MHKVSTELFWKENAIFLAWLYTGYIVLWLFVGFIIYRLHCWFNTTHGFLYRELGEPTTGYRFYKWAPWVMLVVSLQWVIFLILAAIWLVPEIYASFSSLPVKG